MYLSYVYSSNKTPPTDLFIRRGCFIIFYLFVFFVFARTVAAASSTRRAGIRIRATDTFNALFLLLNEIKRHGRYYKYYRYYYDYVSYHAFFFALTISAVMIPATNATTHPPTIAGTTAIDVGETTRVPTV